MVTGKGSHFCSVQILQEEWFQTKQIKKVEKNKNHLQLEKTIKKKQANKKTHITEHLTRYNRKKEN